MRRTNTRLSNRSWMPVTDNHIGSGDSRLWQRDSKYDFDWQSTDPWTRRVVYYADVN